jgi:hypothetical protein
MDFYSGYAQFDLGVLAEDFFVLSEVNPEFRAINSK